MAAFIYVVMMESLKILKDKGLKATPQRIALIEVLLEHPHLDIEAIHDRLREKIPSISVATIYNNLKALQNAGIVREVKIPFHKPLYEVDLVYHIHAVCKRCGRIKDVNVDYRELFSKFRDMVKDEILGIDAVLIVECEECKS